MTAHEEHKRSAKKEIKGIMWARNGLYALDRIYPIGCLAQVAFALAYSTVFDDPAKKTAAVNIRKTAGAITGLPKRVSFFGRLVANTTGGIFHVVEEKTLFVGFNFSVRRNGVT
jgi:hypothetical protein